MEEEPWKRIHVRGIMEEALGRHLEGIWESSGSHLEATRSISGDIRRCLEASGRHLEAIAMLEERAK